MLSDGVGLNLGSKILGLESFSDLNGTDLFPQVIAFAEADGLRVFLLGGRGSVVEDARTQLARRYPAVDIVGCHHGYLRDAELENEVVKRVAASRPDILLVGMDFVRQESFVLRHRAALDVPLIWNVGGLFDFVSNATPRAPHWMRRWRLEWLGRFLRSPRAMWHRNVVAAPWFLAHVLRQRLRPDSTKGTTPPKEWNSRGFVTQGIDAQLPNTSPHHDARRGVIRR